MGANDTTVEFSWAVAGLINDDLISECAELYSSHYGVWSSFSSERAGKQIALAPRRLREWTNSGQARIACAREGRRLIGYAVAIQGREPDYGVVSWVTQFVVHTNYRNRGIGKRLLFSIWGLSDHYAWGIVTANPYAVRALETATRRRCEPRRIGKNKRKLHSIGAAHVSYITAAQTVLVDDTGARINTEFYVDHARIAERIAGATRPGVPWLLGALEEGWEWFAFTFHDQPQTALTAEEIEAMLRTSDDVTRQAYARMPMDGSQPWALHSASEADSIARLCGLKPGDEILDLGCGGGRHAIELGKRGCRVTGVDYVPEFLDAGRRLADSQGVADAVEFAEGDCRTVTLLREYDAVVCLYDVVGSYVDDDNNLAIMRTALRHLKQGGMAIFSVMNRYLTEQRAKHWFSVKREASRLLELPPSRIMENTGNVFNPDYYMIDQDDHIVYRREQFVTGNQLPVELIVRDRRFLVDEVQDMCRAAGFDVMLSRVVRAGAWDAEDTENGKEILVVCRKPSV